MDAHKLLTELRIKAGRGDPPCADMDDVELMYEYFTTERAKVNDALWNAAREHAELEFGEDHEFIDRLAHGVWATWMGYGTANGESE